MERTAHTRRLRQGWAHARHITRRNARTFFFASLFLPEAKRRAAYAVYAICRLSDDTVDQTLHVPGWETVQQAARHIAAAYGDEPIGEPLLAVFRHAIRRYAIPRDYFTLLQEGLCWDREKTRYADFDQLYEYCYRVAGVVGSMMVHLFSSPSRELLRHAVDLGVAMQLTNILRDIREDYGRGRVYLPQDEMARFGVTERHLTAGATDPALRELLRFQIRRARDFYRQADPGIALLPDYRSRLVTRLMSELYERILADIERHHYQTNRRAATTTQEKIATALRVFGRETFA